MSGHRGTRRRIAPGIYQDAYGFGVEARVGKRPNELRSAEQRFPPGTELSALQACWHREKMRLKDAQMKQGGPVVRGALSADVLRYFAAAKRVSSAGKSGSCN